MSEVFFTSDLHLGHKRIAEYRGYEDSDDHDTALMDTWNDTVGKNDTVWVLGDLAASSPTYALDVLTSLPGEKHLILGNHDAAHPMHRNAHTQLRKYLEVFASVASAATRKIDGQYVLLSHFPYERDRDEIRYPQWRLRDEGLPLLHGHTHGEEIVTRTEVWPVDGGPRVRTEIHVGLDAWDGNLVPLDHVARLLKESRTA